MSCKQVRFEGSRTRTQTFHSKLTAYQDEDRFSYSLPLLPTMKFTLGPNRNGPREWWHIKFFRVMLSMSPMSPYRNQQRGDIQLLQNWQRRTDKRYEVWKQILTETEGVKLSEDGPWHFCSSGSVSVLTAVSRQTFRVVSSQTTLPFLLLIFWRIHWKENQTHQRQYCI